MTKYIVFGGECYYPYGGDRDILDTFDTLEDAISYALNQPEHEWIRIYDVTEKMVVWDMDVYKKKDIIKNPHVSYSEHLAKIKPK
jgi:hypothetical protein